MKAQPPDGAAAVAPNAGEGYLSLSLSLSVYNFVFFFLKWIMA